MQILPKEEHFNMGRYVFALFAAMAAALLFNSSFVQSATIDGSSKSELLQTSKQATKSNNNQPLTGPSDLFTDASDAIYSEMAPSALQQNLIVEPITSLTPAIDDLTTAAGHHHGHSYGKYYEYRQVPKKKTWKFGYKRGNKKHTISRHEKGKAGKHPHFKTKVKWHDKKSKGKGVHIWDYNHHDKKHHYG